MTLQAFRADRLAQAATKADVDLVVASLPANHDYVAGYRSVGMDVLARAQAYILFRPRDRHISVVASIAELPSIVEVLGEQADMFCFGTFRFACMAENTIATLITKTQAERNFSSVEEALAAAIQTSGCTKVALDESRCPVPTWNKVVALCPNVTLSTGAEVFIRARMVKHPDEIAGLERSVEIAETALGVALSQFRIGMTELDLERLYKAEVCRLGADNFFFVATAAHRAAYSDTKNTNLSIQKGDMIRFDFGCLYQGYCSDIARTAVVGTPDEKVSTYYEAVRRGTQDAIAAIKPNVSAQEIFVKAVEATRANGLPHYERHHCGHGIGVECYDFPSVAMGDETTLVENMTLCIETPYYEPGWGGVQIENTIVVTDRGARYLDKTGNALIILEG